MTESEVKLAILVAALVILGSALALFACCKVSGDCSRQEEKEKNDEFLETTRTSS